MSQKNKEAEDINTLDLLSQKTKRSKSKKGTKKKPTNKKAKKEENKLRNIQSIKSFKEKKMNEWKDKDKEKLNFNELKDFVNSYDIHNDSQKLFMDNLIQKNKKEFIAHYTKYQFVLDLKTRFEMQKIIQKDESYKEFPMIKYNIIPDDCESIRKILEDVLIDILEIDPESDNLTFFQIKNIFINNKVYFNFVFDFLIPTKYSDNNEYKYNKLLFDIANFFFPLEGILESKEMEKLGKSFLSNRLSLFNYLKPFIEKIHLLNEDDLINNCEFLLNLLVIIEKVEKNKRNYKLFEDIVNMCLPFELNMAKEQLKIIKNYNSNICDCDLIIDNKKIKLFNIEELKEDSNITLKCTSGTSVRQITVKANEINWYLGESLISFFIDDDSFMICFIYKSSLDKNFIKWDKFNNVFFSLFKKMIRSKVVKEAMMQDSEAEQFDYPFDDDDILNECEESIYFVPFPVQGFYGFTDKNSFKAYIYSNFTTSTIKNIIFDYDNIFKTKTHECKHISRIYYHLFNQNISLNTPTIDNKNDSLYSNNVKLMENKKNIVNKAYLEVGIELQDLDEIDYGDLFEKFFIGVKSSYFFLANSYFCLRNSSWSQNSDEFLRNFARTIKEKKFAVSPSKKDEFLNFILRYFKNKKGEILFNETSTKDASKQNTVENETNIYVNSSFYRGTYSHCCFNK